MELPSQSEHLSGTPKQYSYTDYGLARSFPASLGLYRLCMVSKSGTGPQTVQSQFFWRPYTVWSRISRPDRMTVQTGPNRGTVLRSSLKSQDWTAYKSVRSGPVPVPQSGPVSLLLHPLCKDPCLSLHWSCSDPSHRLRPAAFRQRP